MSRRRRTLHLLMIILMPALVTGAAAQQPPDFSGAWTAADGGGGRGRGPAPSETPGSGWGAEITITQKDGLLVVERDFFSRGDLQPALKSRYALDGTPVTNTVMMGRGMQERVCTTAWDGDTLVITAVAMVSTGAGRPDVASEVRRRLTLRPPASLVGTSSLLVETTFGGVLGGPPTTTRTIYTRR